MTPRDLSGATLGGRYRVGALLGAGGMGAVYEATQIDLGRRVAIKVLYDELAWRADLVARFHREAQAAAALGHPNIVQVTDFSPGPPPFLVMELLEGASLQKVVARNGPLAAPRVVFIATQLLSALSAAHRAGLVHRDVKPDNVFLTANAAASDLVKVLDFGVAKTTAPTDHRLTATGEMIGSPAFMAPEQVRGRDADARTDIYAAGVCMYYALTGRLPFTSASLPQLLFAIDEQEPAPVGAIRPDLDPAFIAVVERAMAKRPELRFQSADEMLAALAHSSPRAPQAELFARAASPFVGTAPLPVAAVSNLSPAAPPASAVPGWVVGMIIGAFLLVLVPLVAWAVVRHFRPPDSVWRSGPPVEDAGVDGREAGAKSVDGREAGAKSVDGREAGAKSVDGREAGANLLGVADASGTSALAPHDAQAPASTPPHASVPQQESDAGNAPPPSLGATSVSMLEGGPYSAGHVHAVLTPRIGAIAACVDKTPTSDFNYGTEVMNLGDVFSIAVDAHGTVESVGHPSEYYSRTLHSCLAPIMQSAPWGAPFHPGTFKVSVRSRRRTPSDAGK